MNTALTVLGGLLAAWSTLNLLYYHKREFFESRRIRLMYGCVLVYRAGRVRGASRAWRRASILLVALYAVSVAWFFLVVYSGIDAKLNGTGALRVLVPGVDITGLDLAYFVLALGAAVVLHELFHGKTAVSHNVGVKSFGLAVAVLIPLAFTEIEESDFNRSSRFVKTSVLAAGVAANLALGLLGLALFNIAASPSGVLVTGVVPGSLASRAGIEPYSILLSVNGVSPRGVEDLRSLLSNATATVLNITLLTPRGAVETVSIARNATERKLGVYVTTPPASWLISVVGVYPAVQLLRAFFWLYLVNFNLAILNAAPLFITDGGRIVFEVLGGRFKKAALLVNAVSLLALAFSLAPLP
ncbi:site-2 protease family protein [Thermogladius sp. KZ2Tp1]|uniref:site-2 protease family protein n=1 Tax=Thermogladius sp. KZ2Tp1 TaxID=3136289 RepID=UPI003DA8D71A